MKKINFIILISLMYISIVNGQSNLFTNIKQGVLTNMKPIIKNEMVEGYYMIYPLDKTSNKTYDFELNILDNNLKITHTLNIPSTKSTNLIDGAFNGEFFCFTFYDPKNKENHIEHILVNLNGEIVSKLSSKVVYFVYDPDNMNTLLGVKKYIYAIDNIGFAWVKKTSANKSIIEVFDNTGKIIWTSVELSDEKNIVDNIRILHTNQNRILVAATFNQSPWGNIERSCLISYNSITGEKILTKEFPFNKYAGIFQDAEFNEKNKTYDVFGEFYESNSSKKMNGNQKLGIFNFTIDSTNNVTENYLLWDDFAKKINMKSNGKMEKGQYVYFHQMHKNSNGSIYFIGEQYKISLAGQINSIMNPIAGEIKVYTNNIIVVKLNDQFQIDSIFNYKKNKTSYTLPSPLSYGFSNDEYGITELMSYYQLFDFQFSTSNLESDNFNSVFVNFDKMNWQNTGSNYTIHNVSLDESDKLIDYSIELNTKPNFFSVLPAKPGYIAIYEYFKKDKSANLRLEKLDL